MQTEIILALVGTSALVLVVFMREILGPFMQGRGLTTAHKPSDSPNANIGKLFSVIHDFRSDTTNCLKDNKQDHDHLLAKVSRLERWHEPNEQGQQTWKGTELAGLMTQNNKLLAQLVEAQTETNTAIKKIANVAPCAPQGGD